MNDLEDLLDRIRGDLAGVGSALVGGIAVSVRAEPRFTRDVDLAVAVADDEEAEALVARLSERGWRVTETLEHEVAGRLTAARLQPQGETTEGRVVDLLFASSGIENEIVAGAEELEVLPGIRALVASIGHLIVLKVLASAEDRPQDGADLVALLERADGEDLRIAREAGRLVVERGYNRDKDLVGEIERLVAPG